jgi:hypothetical protein
MSTVKQSYNVGDAVIWASEANGSRIIKRGTIVAVVDAGISPMQLIMRNIFLLA